MHKSLIIVEVAFFVTLLVNEGDNVNIFIVFSQ